MTNDPSPTAQNAPKFTLSRYLDVRDGSTHSRELSDSSTFVDTAPSSRASTPDSAATLTASYRGANADRHWNEKTENGKAVGCPDDDILVVVGAAGRLPEEVYERTLSWWRAGIRRAILRNVEWESRVLAAMQVCGSFVCCQSTWRIAQGAVVSRDGSLPSTLPVLRDDDLQWPAYIHCYECEIVK